MNMATNAPSRPGVFAGFDRSFATTQIAPLTRAWSDHRTYRRTLAELRALSIRQREDLGIVGEDLAAIARMATYGR